ncbi:hypothetical protein [Corynebacterium lowii]|uniref:Uncharacterized protein n=1 Tax=Corynebacterium lowii TaxID=1544413 RepID=A0A0Q0YY94_9CORY|nr:hypothetical protein [Corynebacterium lowii]KQB87368.1 hypothetical protein Clow_00427 [Corynebacterium lowii]MDP9852042.1 hypothetical protein [Corynebacterium lowii]
MKDPTRIAPLIALIQEAWEAQPDLAFSELWGIVENRGIGWGATDEQLAQILREILRERPVAVGEKPVLVHTTGPEYAVSIHPEEGAVVVRHPQRERQPAWWSFNEVVQGRVGAPLVLRDKEDITHRLGVISGIEAIAPRPGDLSGMRRRQLGDALYACRLEDGALVLISHSIEVYSKERRSVAHSTLRWEKIEAGALGTGLVVRLRDGGELKELGRITALLVLR